MIFQSKLTVIMKFSLNIQEFLNDRKQDKGNHSVHYHSLCQVILFFVILSVNGSGESSHNGLSEGVRSSLNQPTGTSGRKQTKQNKKPNQTKPTAACGKKLPAATRAEEKPARRHCGATLPPASHRNQNAPSPEEDSLFLLGFRAEDWTAWMRKLRGMPVRTRERKGISRRGPAQPPLDSQPSAEP